MADRAAPRGLRRRAGIAVVLAGALLMAGTVGSVVWGDHRTGRAQARLLAEVPEGPAPVTAVVAGERLGHEALMAVPVDEGEALAVLRVPRLGEGWRWVALEGTSPDVLADGPGHYRGTALPGAPGNTAFAAHRAGHGSPFLDFDDLRVGDQVIVEQGRVRWVYELRTAPRIVLPTATWVLRQTRRPELTLTTCWPKYGSAKRMFVRGALVAVRRVP